MQAPCLNSRKSGSRALEDSPSQVCVGQERVSAMVTAYNPSTAHRYKEF